MIRYLLTTLMLVFAGNAWPATYYVDPAGDDARDGLKPATAWRTVGHVNAAPLTPGDSVLFLRGGEWHESLTPQSSGADGKPIVFNAYGTGAKPKFWGSDVLDSAAWKTEGTNIYVYKGLKVQNVTQVLANHGTEKNGQWFSACGGKSIVESSGKFDWHNGELRLNSTSDPRSDGRVYTAVTRQDVIQSNGKQHLVFKNLSGDECADPANGYVIRVMDSQDVRVEDCEAYRGGRHNIGVINSTGIVVMRAKTAYAMPKIEGGATFYVNYAGGESRYANCTCSWIDCAADHFEDGGGGKYLYFVCHGEKLGPISFQNPLDHGGKFSFLQDNPAQVVTVTGGLIEDADFELFCNHATFDGITLTGDSAIDCYGCDNTFQNLKLSINPKGGGQTGYGAAILLRDSAQRSVFRFNTVVMDKSAPSDKPCLAFVNPSQTAEWYGNIFMSTGRAVHNYNAPLSKENAANADYNLYNANATFGNLNFSQWKAQGFGDAHSREGAAKFINAAAQDYTLEATSPAVDGVPLTGKAVPASDFNGSKRPVGAAADMGAFEYAPDRSTAAIRP